VRGSSGGRVHSSLSKTAEARSQRSEPPDTNSYNPHTLRADLANGRLPAARVLEIGLALSEALAHLHKNGLVHRDVKPSNVIFVNGRPKLADIGLVTDASDQCSIVGTEGYLPPEGPGTPQADIFALGKVLYEAATGMDRRKFAELPAELRSWPDTKQVIELNEVILKACDSDSRSRYATAEELRADLELLKTGGSVISRRAAQQRCAVAKGIAAAAALGLLVAAGTVSWHQTHRTRPLSGNAKALDYYDLACYQIRNRALETLLPAYANLTEALRLDPGFVDAHFKMFELYFGPLGNYLPPRTNYLENLRDVATKLRKVAPDSVQYHTANSWMEFLDSNFDRAIAEARLAIQKNPKFLRAHAYYAYYLLKFYGDADASLREYETALNLDPERNDTTIKALLYEPYLFKREFDMAIQKGREAVELERRNPFAHYNLAQVYLTVGQYANCLDELKAGDVACGAKPETIEPRYEKLHKALAVSPQELLKVRLVEVNANPNSDAYDKALLHARLGEWGAAVALLKQAFDKKPSRAMVGILGEPCWDSVRNEKWFQAGLEKMGFCPSRAGSDERHN